MNQRGRAAQLAKTDFAGAFKFTESMKNLRERIQALGWVARYAPAEQITRVITAVNKCLGKSSDKFESAMSLAWPLRALHEIGKPKLIPPLLKTATQLATGISPAASRAEALGILVQAVLPAGLTIAAPAISSLTLLGNDSNWRVVRTLVDVSLLVNAEDRQRSLDIANLIGNENKRAATIERIQGGEQTEPRPFFW